MWAFFGSVWVGVCKCDLFLAGCRWVWVSVGSARFITTKFLQPLLHPGRN